MNLNEDNPGATSTPSILSIVANQCLEEFAPFYRANSDGSWTLRVENSEPASLTEDDVCGDIREWVLHLEGDDAIGAKIVSLIRGNKGWPVVIARRVMQQLKSYSC